MHAAVQQALHGAAQALLALRQLGNKAWRSGHTCSAAPVGVGARRSATKSAMVKSVSCPTPLMVGIGQAASARATVSSLNAHKSSMLPPPRQTISTSTSWRSAAWVMAATICAGAASPCTRVGDKSTKCADGMRRRSVLTTSSKAAPDDETMPMRRGNAGSGQRYGVEQPFFAQLALEPLEGFKQPA